VFSLYGAFAPVGFFTGIFFAGLSAQFITWGWFFYIGAMILAIVGVVSYLCIPNEKDKIHGKGVQMDWWGTATVVPGLVLIVFALTDGSHAPNGWATPYIIITFVIGWIFIAAFIYIEGWIAEQPLLPGDMFHVKGMKWLATALFFQYGTFGIFLFYASF
jgi:MFS family permease